MKLEIRSGVMVARQKDGYWSPFVRLTVEPPNEYRRFMVDELADSECRVGVERTLEHAVDGAIAWAQRAGWDLGPWEPVGHELVAELRERE